MRGEWVRDPSGGVGCRKYRVSVMVRYESSVSLRVGVGAPMSVCVFVLRNRGVSNPLRPFLFSLPLVLSSSPL